MDELPSSSKRRGSRCVQCHLPKEILVQVFSHLPDSDRCRARLTCSYWRDVFSLPELWRRHSFVFGPRDWYNGEPQFYDCERQGWRARRYLELYGQHLHYLGLEINIIVPYFGFGGARSKYANDIRFMSNSVEQVLKANPKGMKLKTLTCHGLRNIQYERSRVINALSQHLKRQTTLQEVKFSFCGMNKIEVIKVLGAMIRNPTPSPSSRMISQTSTLTDLSLTDCFFDAGVHPVDCLEEMPQFITLQRLALDFRSLDDNVLEKLTSSIPRLESISLIFKTIERGPYGHLYPMASSAGWKAALLKLPKLRVLVKISVHDMMDIEIPFQALLAPGMPLHSLCIQVAPLDKANHTMEQVSHLMVHVSRHFNLENFKLTWLYRRRLKTWSRPEELIELVTGCPSLTCLHMRMILPMDTLLRVAAAANQRPASLAAPVPLRIELGGSDVVLGKRAMARLSAVNPTCSIKIVPNRWV